MNEKRVAAYSAEPDDIRFLNLSKTDWTCFHFYLFHLTLKTTLMVKVNEVGGAVVNKKLGKETLTNITEYIEGKPYRYQVKA